MRSRLKVVLALTLVATSLATSAKAVVLSPEQIDERSGWVDGLPHVSENHVTLTWVDSGHATYNGLLATYYSQIDRYVGPGINFRVNNDASPGVEGHLTNYSQGVTVTFTVN